MDRIQITLSTLILILTLTIVILCMLYTYADKVTKPNKVFDILSLERKSEIKEYVLKLNLKSKMDKVKQPDLYDEIYNKLIKTLESNDNIKVTSTELSMIVSYVVSLINMCDGGVIQ